MIPLLLLVVIGLGYRVALQRHRGDQRLARRLAMVLGRYTVPTVRRARRTTRSASVFDRLRAELDDTLRYAGVQIRAAEYLRLAGGIIAGAIVFGYLVRGVGGSLVLAVAAAGVAWWWPRMRARALAERFREELPAALESMAASLGAGLSVHEAVRATADDAAEPVGEAFQELARSVALGMSVDDATRAITRRFRVEELAYFGAALRLTQQTGADLGKILLALAQALRERHEAQAELRALTTQGRMSAYILTGLPGAIGAFFYLIDPAYGHTLLGTRVGLLILALTAILLTIGWVAVQRIIAVA